MKHVKLITSKLSPSNDPADPNNIVPTITVYRDKDHPSRLELPFIPSKCESRRMDKHAWKK